MPAVNLGNDREEQPARIQKRSDKRDNLVEVHPCRASKFICELHCFGSARSSDRTGVDPVIGCARCRIVDDVRNVTQRFQSDCIVPKRFSQLPRQMQSCPQEHCDAADPRRPHLKITPFQQCGRRLQLSADQTEDIALSFLWMSGHDRIRFRASCECTRR